MATVDDKLPQSDSFDANPVDFFKSSGDDNGSYDIDSDDSSDDEIFFIRNEINYNNYNINEKRFQPGRLNRARDSIVEFQTDPSNDKFLYNKNMNWVATMESGRMTVFAEKDQNGQLAPLSEKDRIILNVLGFVVGKL